MPNNMMGPMGPGMTAQGPMGPGMGGPMGPGMGAPMGPGGPGPMADNTAESSQFWGWGPWFGGFWGWGPWGWW